MSISNLPTELLRMIFENVDDENKVHLPHVCRRWREISKLLILGEYEYKGDKSKCVRFEAAKINETLRMFKRVEKINLFHFEFAQCSTLRAILHDLPFHPVSLTLNDVSRRWQTSTFLSLKEYVERNHIPTHVFTKDGLNPNMYGCNLYPEMDFRLPRIYHNPRN